MSPVPFSLADLCVTTQTDIDTCACNIQRYLQPEQSHGVVLPGSASRRVTRLPTPDPRAYRLWRPRHLTW